MDRVSVQTSVPGLAVITLEGEHELYGATKLQERLESLIAEGKSVVVDLTHAEFVDSSVVGVLLTTQELAAGSGVDYALVVGESTGEPVRRMFEVTGLTRILPVVESSRVAP